MLMDATCQIDMPYWINHGRNFNPPPPPPPTPNPNPHPQPPGQNGRHLANDIFKRIFLNEIVRIFIKMSLKFAFKCPIDNNQALVQIMAWHRKGNKPLSEPMRNPFTDEYMRH